MRLPRVPLPVLVASLAALYVATAKLGLQFAYLNQSATAVWPPTGIALAALLLLGLRLWPGVWIGAFVTNLTINGHIPQSLGIATGNTLEAVIGAWLVLRLAHGRRVFERTPDVFRFVWYAATIATAVSATIGVASLAVSGGLRSGTFGGVWLTWWLGDMVSALVVTPLVVTWATAPRARRNPAHLAEGAAMLAVVALTSALVFGEFIPSRYFQFQRPFLVFLPLLWAALRFGRRGASAATLLISGIAFWATIRGHGILVLQDPNDTVLLLQMFAGTTIVTGLLLAVAVFERETAAASLQRGQEAAVRRLTANLAVTRILAEAPTSAVVLPKLLQTIGETLGWEVGAAWMVDADANVLRCRASWRTVGRSVDAFEREGTRRTFGRGIGLPGRVWATGQPAFVPDVTRDDNFPRAPLAVQTGLHAGFAFPVTAGDTFLGVMEFFSHEIRQPDEELLAMVNIAGGQIGQVIERRKAEEALRVVQKQMAAVTDITPVLLTRCGRDLTYKYVNRAYAAFLDLPAERIVGRAIVEVIGQTAFEAIRPQIERVLEGDRVEYEEAIPFSTVGARHLRVVYVPERNEQGDVQGWVASLTDVTDQRRAEQALRESEERYRAELESRVIARTLQLDATNRRLQAEVEERQRLEGEIARASEREQQRLGQELHDGIGQRLAGMGLLMAAFEMKLMAAAPELNAEARRIQSILMETADEARGLARRLYPIELERDELFVALHALARRTSDHFGVQCDLRSSEPLEKVDGASAIQLFRIAQEAVHNALKHGPVREIQISLTAEDGHWVLIVKDDGPGFPPALDASKTMGLRIMSYRARILGGRVDFHCDPLGGAVVRCVAPRVAHQLYEKAIALPQDG